MILLHRRLLGRLSRVANVRSFCRLGMRALSPLCTFSSCASLVYSGRVNYTHTHIYTHTHTHTCECYKWGGEQKQSSYGLSSTAKLLSLLT